MREIYLDNAAATTVSPDVIRAVAHAAREVGNPSSFNDAGRRARALLDNARTRIAAFLSARPDEVVLCASGSEANTLVVQGVLAAAGIRTHIVASAIEHPSVLESLHASGTETTLIKPDREGRISAEDVLVAIRSDTVLVSVMYANNEVGSIQPIKQIAKAIRSYRRIHRTPYPYFHTDACQATAWLPMDVQALGIDLLTLNGTKAYGPRGTAALFVRRGTPIRSLVRGGDQELGRRAGTENVPGAAGLATVLDSIRPTDVARIEGLREAFLTRISDLLPDVRLNGPRKQWVLPNIINLSIPGVSSEALLLELDRFGIRAGAGSACTAHRVDPSHVLVAMQVPKRYLDGALRFSLSRDTTKRDMDRLATVLPRAIAAVRARRSGMPAERARRRS